MNHRCEDKEVHTFPKGICLKVNVIAWLEFEFMYYDFAVHRFSYNTIGTPPCSVWGGAWVRSKTFLWFFVASDENWSFLILYEKYWKSLCTTCLIRNSCLTRYSDTPRYLVCWVVCQSWIPGMVANPDLQGWLLIMILLGWLPIMP